MVDLPRGAGAIEKMALAEGWEVEPDPRSGAGFIALRLRRASVLLVACWTEGKYSGAFAQPWGPGGITTAYNARQLREILAIPGDEFQWPADPLKADLPDDERQNMAWEKEYLGAYVTKHPLEFVNMGQYPDVMSVIDFLEQGLDLAGERVQLLGLIEEADVRRARNTGNWWAKYDIADLTGITRALAFGKTAQQIKTGALLHLKGKVDVRDESPVFIANHVTEVFW